MLPSRTTRGWKVILKHITGNYNKAGVKQWKHLSLFLVSRGKASWSLLATLEGLSRSGLRTAPLLEPQQYVSSGEVGLVPQYCRLSVACDLTGFPPLGLSVEAVHCPQTRTLSVLLLVVTTSVSRQTFPALFPLLSRKAATSPRGTSPASCNHHVCSGPENNRKTYFPVALVQIKNK